MLTESCEKVAYKFYCEKCDYGTCKKSSYDKHLFTSKHTTLTTLTNVNKSCEKSLTHFDCINCNKIFKSRVGLWKHKKKCFEIKDDKDEYSEYNIEDKDTLILQLLKQNGDLQKSLIELSKEKSITNSHSNSHNNSHNKTFNLQIFLNETCKDAMNIMDFVRSIKPSLDDLENTGRKGYVEGISDLILKNLRALDQTKRPIHCSDLKRETLYIKDKDAWEKEGEDKPILTNAIKTIAFENIKQIQSWKEKYPGCTDADSRKNDMYLKIMLNAMSGSSEEECEKNLNKIISNVIKETTIQKDNV
jgi:hypothetical protein